MVSRLCQWGARLPPVVVPSTRMLVGHFSNLFVGCGI